MTLGPAVAVTLGLVVAVSVILEPVALVRQGRPLVLPPGHPLLGRLSLWRCITMCRWLRAILVPVPLHPTVPRANGGSSGGFVRERHRPSGSKSGTAVSGP